MTYPVMLTDRAHVEMGAAYSWWAEHRSQALAAQWYDAIADAIESLADYPDRCAVSRENDHFPYEMRDLYFGIGHGALIEPCSRSARTWIWCSPFAIWPSKTFRQTTSPRNGRHRAPVMPEKR